MYAFINGKIDEITADQVVIEANNIGYAVTCTSTVLNSVEIGQTTKIFTYQHVREDAIILFGFASKEERTMFLRLISVSGIGPKSAIQVLSSISAKDLALILISGDYNALCKVPGIGKKTAQRMVLELKEKVDSEDIASSGENSFVPQKSSVASDAVFALTALGYSAQEAASAVNAVAGSCKTTEEVITAVLKGFDRR